MALNVKRILIALAHWVLLVYTVLVIGTAFVPHEADHTRLDHLFPIVVRVVLVWATYQKPKGN